MTRINIRHILLLTLLWLSPGICNPVMVLFFSELQVTGSGWVLEMHSQWGEYDLANWFLTSGRDTAYFHDGQVVDSGYVIFTPDSLEGTLILNTNADTLTLHDAEGYWVDQLTYGNGYFPMPVAPRSYQSICITVDGFTCLDNSPTFGFPGDSAGTKGHLHGTVLDIHGHPLSDVRTSVGVSTDSAGHFHCYEWASYHRHTFKKDGYLDHDRMIMVYPDSSVFITIEMLETTHSIDSPGQLSLDRFLLLQNYPNPFNPSTTFAYQLPVTSYLELVIYNHLGQVVERLYSGRQPQGDYQVPWDASDLPSGIYIVQLRTPTHTLSRKCLLLK